MKSLNALLHHIVDYAGLFPPAALSLDQTVRNFLQYQNHRRFWMLGRLIIPAGKLKSYSEFCDTAKIDADGWRISSLIPSINADDGAFQTAIESIQEFNEADQFGQVDAVEGKVESPDDVAKTLRAIPDAWQTFLEVDWKDPEAIIQTLAERKNPNAFAKIRTGSVKAEEIPSSEHVATFIHHCARHQVGFKATAGLHHPIRAEYPLTYEEQPPRSTMHGFSNVFVAACFASSQGWNADKLVELISDTDTASFRFENDRIVWRDEVLEVDQVSETRQRFAKSFGSCSFEEPVADLESIGWLASPANTI